MSFTVKEFDQAGKRPTEKIGIRRPGRSDWPEMLDVLRSANFDAIGSPEMPVFPLEDCFVACVEGRLCGVGGYRILDATTAKTTLLAVRPGFAELRLGARLQEARLGYLRQCGIRTVFTNTDDERVARWLERDFGFRRTGATVPKLCDFGRPEVDRWTTLRVDLG